MSGRYRVVDLFAGCGGLSVGFRQSGLFMPVGAVEADAYAAATYAENFGADHITQGDIAAWVDGDLPEADVVVGGPPCQGFSNLGSKREDDDRNHLWEHYVTALVKIQPKVFLLENVDGFLHSRQFAALQRLVRYGRLRSYKLDFEVVRATDFGSAQLRKRAIIIGTHKDIDQIEVPRKRRPAEEWRTLKEALDGVPTSIPEDHIDLPERDIVERYGLQMAGPYRSDELHVTRYYSQLSKDRFDEIPYGGSRMDLPDHLKAPCWRKHTTGSRDVMGRLRWEHPSVTIRCEFYKPEKGRYLHPDEDRALTPYEAALIQGFPDEFRWWGPKYEIARQIGNAVPVELAEALARRIGEGLTRS
ncbi:DNA cytosine methyltransferase [Actinophytocola sp.]|uniref:DNA cytosine methyltransferase n=1 Tax=Actinophytocola sp. TaxID=1872138 RepID=UPI00389B1568